jgi:serine/threonine protein kinase
MNRDALARGTRLGRYEILRPLSSGGMGELYLARVTGEGGFERLVALKRLLPTQGAGTEATRQLLEEARLMASLQHPNIAQVYDAGRTEGGAFFAMEYVRGETLAGVLSGLARRSRGLSLTNALWIARGVASALSYAHDKRLPNGEPARIVHRDVSPANVMITTDGTIKLIDFGVAKAAQRNATLPGTIKGNPRYMSPEQTLGLDLDHRSDLFSLGIVLFELTTGTRWLRERDDLLAAQQMLHGEYPKPSERRSRYPARLEEIVLKALARDRELRFADAREFQGALEDFARDEHLTLSNLEMADTMRTLPGASAASTQQELDPSTGGVAATLRLGPPNAASAASGPDLAARIAYAAQRPNPNLHGAERSGLTLPIEAELGNAVVAVTGEPDPSRLPGRRWVLSAALVLAVCVLLFVWLVPH